PRQADELDPIDVRRAERGLTVLYVEDDPSNLRLVEQILAFRPGIELLRAQVGSAAIELARQHQPDLILLDLHLPDMPGEQVLTEMRQRSSARVIVVSADATAPSMRRALAAGADWYLTKPLDVRRFLEVLDETLELAR
ncbi:MAG: response regulator, partial [Actinomycetota bacterium]